MCRVGDRKPERCARSVRATSAARRERDRASGSERELCSIPSPATRVNRFTNHMFLSTHATVGALISTITESAPLAFFLGVVSHFLIDMIPHGDTHLHKNYKNGERVRRAIAYVVIDAIVMVGVVLWLTMAVRLGTPRAQMAGIIGGLLPDALVGLGEIWHTRWLSSFTRFHFFFHNYFVHRRRDLAFRYGVTMQMIILGALLTSVA